MGYARGIQWTDELIATEVMKVANQFNPPRMPSNSEAIVMTGSHALSNAISKHGGYKYWAVRLGLEQKKTDTKLGVEGEKHIAEELFRRGYTVEMTSARHPYDILVNGCVKVDVKTANISYVRGYPIHSYRLAKGQPTCDFYVMYEVDTEKVYVVPSWKLLGQVQVGMGIDSKLYKKYLEAYHLLAEASDMYKSM